MVKTATPGIYRRGRRYVVTFRDRDRVPRKHSAATFAEARELKATLTADVLRGEYRPASKLSFRDYAKEWIQTYQGRTCRGIRPETLADYRRDLGLDRDGGEIGDGAIAHFGRIPLAAIEPRDVKRYAHKLAERGLSAGSIRNALAPVRALLATAYEDGLIRNNPAAGLRISQRINTNPNPHPKALTEPELLAFLDALQANGGSSSSSSPTPAYASAKRSRSPGTTSTPNTNAFASADASTAAASTPQIPLRPPHHPPHPHHDQRDHPHTRHCRRRRPALPQPNRHPPRPCKGLQPHPQTRRPQSRRPVAGFHTSATPAEPSSSATASTPTTRWPRSTSTRAPGTGRWCTWASSLG